MQFLPVLDKVYVFIQHCLCKVFQCVRQKEQSVCNYAGEATIHTTMK